MHKTYWQSLASAGSICHSVFVFTGLRQNVGAISHACTQHMQAPQGTVC